MSSNEDQSIRLSLKYATDDPKEDFLQRFQLASKQLSHSMPSPEDAAAPVNPPPPSLSIIHPLHVAKSRPAERDESPQTSTASLPLRTASPPASTPRTSIGLSERISRSVSPHGRLSISVSRLGRASVASPLSNYTDTYDDTRTLIVRSFSPAIAIYASSDTEELARGKGFKAGFRELVRPFGERVTGKVVVRDSAGSSRAWGDFGVRFANLGEDVGLETSRMNAKYGAPFTRLEELLERYVEMPSGGLQNESSNGETLRPTDTTPQMSPYYRLFLSRLLSATASSPHETFLHPAACVIAISSRNQAPIETLRQLYSQTAQGSKVSPSFVNPEYLRYYVLVHDEDRDDISISSALFDQMKRHFGLHCHLLRLRSDECLSTDDDSVEVPPCEWLSPAEDLSRLNEIDNLIEMDIHLPQLFESDVTALKSFVRELVAQSVVPHMENRVALWNDQVASRRRGISGRFMSISKKWAGFGSSSSRNSSQSGGGSGASGNYDSLQGFYRYDTPEAILRKLADYAFMLRDYKLAASTYEMLRTDYGNDKAWKYHAGANEMCALSNLLNPLATAAKTRVDGFDQMMETASYSYLTRCSDPQNTLRCIALGVELLKVRGRTAAEAAAKWGIRILELGLVGAVGHVLVSERVASCFAAQVGTGNGGFGARRRKAALWNIMAADEWLKLGKAELAAQRLEDADALHGASVASEGLHGFKEMSLFLEQLHLAVRMKAEASRSRAVSNASNGAFEPEEEKVQQVTEETSERLNAPTHRRSMLIPGTSLDTGPLSPIRSSRPDIMTREEDDDFE